MSTQAQLSHQLGLGSRPAQLDNQSYVGSGFSGVRDVSLFLSKAPLQVQPWSISAVIGPSGQSFSIRDSSGDSGTSLRLPNISDVVCDSSETSRWSPSRLDV